MGGRGKVCFALEGRWTSFEAREVKEMEGHWDKRMHCTRSCASMGGSAVDLGLPAFMVIPAGDTARQPDDMACASTCSASMMRSTTRASISPFHV